MRISFLGTGDAGGVPLYGCACPACERARADRSCRRGPCCALVESGDTRILLDAGLMDLTERFAPGSLSAIVLTHFHADHVQGLFHLRWGTGAPLAVHAPPDPEGCADLYRNHGLLDFRAQAALEAFSIGDLTLTPLPLHHSKPTFGYAIEEGAGARFAYLTDTTGLPPATEDFLKTWRADGIALDCSHPPRDPPPRNHNDFPRAMATLTTLAPRRAWLTHVGHAFDRWCMEAAPVLPHGMAVARDGDVAELATSS